MKVFRMNKKELLLAIGSGLAGAATTNVLHETTRKKVSKAPRVDLIGMQALAKILHKFGKRPPRHKKLRGWTLAGDILSNAFYYSWIYSKSKKKSWRKSIILGTAAGLGAVWLPGPMHLNKRHTNKTDQTKLMTVGLYLAGALATAAIQNALQKSVK